MPDLIATAGNAGSFNTLLKAAETAGVVDILKSPGPYTVFAPTDEAFDKLPQETLDSLLQNTRKLKRIILYHVAFGDVRSEDLKQIDEAPTVEGSVLAIDSTDEKIQVNDANVLKTDILTDNGVIHVIDKVLIPELVKNE